MILAEQVKQRSIPDKSVLEGTLMKATNKNNAEGFFSRQFCLVQVEGSHQVSFKAGIISGIIPTPSLYSNESEVQKLKDLVQGHTVGSKAVARTLVSKLPGQISFYIILPLGGLKKKGKV